MRSLLTGYQHASTLTHYAHYLHARITAYRTVKHDIVRVQAENNRASAYRTHTEGASGGSFSLPPPPIFPSSEG